MGNKNLVKRIVSAAILAPLALAVVYFGKIYFFAFSVIVVLLAVYELENLLRAKGLRLYSPLNYIFSIAIIWSFYSLNFNLLVVLFLMFIILQNLYELFNHEKDSIIVNSGHTFIIAYIAFFFGAFVAIREFSPSIFMMSYEDGAFFTFAVLITIWSCDTFAYFGGTLFGKHRLYEKVSPKKSIEGSIIGFTFAFIINYFFCKAFLPMLPDMVIAAIGIITSVFAQLGDLIESLYKRDAGVKDSGKTIPGHGGVLDRIDSILFVFPAIFIFLYIYQHVNAII